MNIFVFPGYIFLHKRKWLSVPPIIKMQTKRQQKVPSPTAPSRGHVLGETGLLCVVGAAGGRSRTPGPALGGVCPRPTVPSLNTPPGCWARRYGEKLWSFSEVFIPHRLPPLGRDSLLRAGAGDTAAWGPGAPGIVGTDTRCVDGWVCRVGRLSEPVHDFFPSPDPRSARCLGAHPCRPGSSVS